jgi:dicarboxylate/amino acid:cation (Na+ or H+) symporter, DAACS family
MSAPADLSRPAWPLHTQTMIGLTIGLSLGIGLNLLRGAWPGLAPVTEWLTTTTNVLGQLFLRLMFAVVLPLVFSALALAVIEIGEVGRLGRLGFKTLVYAAVLSMTAVLIGIGLVNLIQPGKSISEERRDQLIQQYAGDSKDRMTKADQIKPFDRVIIDLIPENPVQEFAGALDGSSKGNGMLAVMVFALIVGLAAAANPNECSVFVGWLRGLSTMAQTVIHFAMRLAPYGAGCLVFTVAARLGLEILWMLFWFVLTALLGLSLHLWGTYSLVVWWFGKRSPRQFFRDVTEASLVAFSTSSSSATLPTALQTANEKLKLPPRVSNFVLTVGATGNQNGTALYEGVVILFLAQVMNVELSGAQQFQVVLMSLIAGIGTAGVPGGSIPLVVAVMQSVGVPGPSIGLILGIDRLLDMCRTVVNVIGDLVITVCVAQSESESAETPGDPHTVPA